MPEFTNDLTHDDLALLLLLAEKRSLTRSAMTLAWSTPKASHRLNHARALIGDELFVHISILQQKSLCFIDFERKYFGNFMHLLD